MFDREFIVDGIQGGAGTSANMNMNEVIANRAIEMLCEKKGDYSIVHPNDHVNMGATAIGTAINTSPFYLDNIVPTLARITGHPLTQADDLFDATENLDSFVRVSSCLKACAVNLSKMCNDLRILASGPKAGFGEITLPAMQNGSSIMPGKVNPVIPEVVTQVAFHIIGHDTTITMAAEAGQNSRFKISPDEGKRIKYHSRPILYDQPKRWLHSGKSDIISLLYNVLGSSLPHIIAQIRINLP